MYSSPNIHITQGGQNGWDRVLHVADEKWAQNLTSKTRSEKHPSLLGCDTVLIGDSS